MLRIHLPAELETFVQQLIDSGEYSDPSAIVHDALWLFKDHEAPRAIKLAELRELIAVGVEQADRGQVAPLDMKAIKAEATLRLQREQELAELKKLIAVGAEQADRGELIDGEIVFAKLQEKIRQRSEQVP